MNATKLIDFSSEQLQILLDTIVSREVYLEDTIQAREDLFLNAGAQYPMDVPQIAKEHKELDTLYLWHTQVLDAIGKVGIMEQIANC